MVRPHWWINEGKIMTDEDIIAIRDNQLPDQGEAFDCLAFARCILTAQRDTALTERDALRERVEEMRQVLQMVATNNRVDAGEKRKAWNGQFVVEEVRRVLVGGFKFEVQRFLLDRASFLRILRLV